MSVIVPLGTSWSMEIQEIPALCVTQVGEMYQLSHQGILLGLKYKLKLKMLVIKFMVAMEG